MKPTTITENEDKDIIIEEQTIQVPEARKPESPRKRNQLYTDLVESKQSCSLPLEFNVKYLGCCPTDGVWGIAHTRKQVDLIVAGARSSSKSAPNVVLHMEENGIALSAAPNNRNPDFQSGFIPIQNISYGVQDLIYTRVFAMIIVHESENPEVQSPFECLAFACDRADTVYKLTQGLAECFKRFAAADVDSEDASQENASNASQENSSKSEVLIDLKFDTEVDFSNA